MIEAVKIAARVAIIAGVTIAILAVFAGIIALISSLIGEVDYGLVTNAISKGKAFVNYYMGGYTPLVNLGLTLVFIRFAAVPLLKVGFIATKWILTVNK